MTLEQDNSDVIYWATDSLGAVASLIIDTSVYSKTAIFKTAYWYTERCYIFLARCNQKPDYIEIAIRPKTVASQDELIGLCREFANNLIDQQVRQDVIRETGAIRDSLVQKAFFEGSRRLKPGSLKSNEEYVPEPDQSYQTDPLKIARPTGGS